MRLTQIEIDAFLQTISVEDFVYICQKYEADHETNLHLAEYFMRLLRTDVAGGLAFDLHMEFGDDGAQ